MGHRAKRKTKKVFERRIADGSSDSFIHWKGEKVNGTHG